MKILAPLSLAAALLIGSAAYAQSTDQSSSSSTPSAMQANPPSSDTGTSGSAPSQDSSSAGKSVADACKKMAMDKKLSGDDKTKFMKDCKAGKTTREGR
jgi:hypothetical protein